MTDPLEALREPLVPIAPHPDFAARLRRELERAVLDSLGGTAMSATSALGAGAGPVDTASRPVEVELTALTPYLAVDDSRRALKWYADAFGARQQGDPIVMPDGRIGHAQLVIGDAVLMFADEAEDLGLLSPRTRGGVSQSLLLQVPDVDRTVARAVGLGAELARAVADYPHGRNGVVLDPFGHRWMISSQPTPVESQPARMESLSPAEQPTPTAAPGHGDLAYVTHSVPDAELAKEFYGAVLGWRFTPGRVEDGWQIEGTSPMAGLHGGAAAEIKPCYQVDDLEVALGRVLAHGGSANEPEAQPYGRIAACTDNQGRNFWLVQS